MSEPFLAVRRKSKDGLREVGARVCAACGHDDLDHFLECVGDTIWVGCNATPGFDHEPEVCFEILNAQEASR